MKDAVCTNIRGRAGPLKKKVNLKANVRQFWVICFSQEEINDTHYPKQWIVKREFLR